MPNDLDPEQLRKNTSSMIEAITSPAFVEAMRQLGQTPPEQRLEVAAKLLKPDVFELRVSRFLTESGFQAAISSPDSLQLM
jgi:hypothetical protein